MRIGFAVERIVTLSDNTAANLILRHMGGPAEFTRRLRQLGDNVTRLDRYEMALNQNVRGDPRDTTSPAAMAASASRFLFGDQPTVAVQDVHVNHSNRSAHASHPGDGAQIGRARGPQDRNRIAVAK